MKVLSENKQTEQKKSAITECQKTQPSQTIVHAQLEMTSPGDADESEANAMADAIVSSGKIRRQISNGTSGSGIAVSTAMENQLAQAQGGGRTMPEGLRSMMENGFGRDFSNVRIHTDSQAAAMSQNLSAKAFTLGNDIYFNKGQFSPNTTSGQHLIAHELTHVVQGSGKVGRFEKYNMVDGVADLQVLRSLPCSEPMPGNKLYDFVVRNKTLLYSIIDLIGIVGDIILLPMNTKDIPALILKAKEDSLKILTPLKKGFIKLCEKQGISSGEELITTSFKIKAVVSNIFGVLAAIGATIAFAETICNYIGDVADFPIATIVGIIYPNYVNMIANMICLPWVSSHLPVQAVALAFAFSTGFAIGDILNNLGLDKFTKGIVDSLMDQDSSKLTKEDVIKYRWYSQDKLIRELYKVMNMYPDNCKDITLFDGNNKKIKTFFTLYRNSVIRKDRLYLRDTLREYLPMYRSQREEDLNLSSNEKFLLKKAFDNLGLYESFFVFAY